MEESDMSKKKDETMMNDAKKTEGGVYLRGLCHLRNEERTFNLSNITTKILKGSKRYEVEDFLVDVLDIEDEKLGW